MNYYMSFNKDKVPEQTPSAVKMNNSSVNIYVRTSQEESMTTAEPTNKSFFLGIANNKTSQKLYTNAAYKSKT